MTLGRLALLALALVAPSALARGMQASCPEGEVTIQASAPMLQYTVTKIDMSWFAPTGRTGPELFRLVLTTSSETDLDARVWVQIAARPSDPALRRRCQARGMAGTGFPDDVCGVQNEISMIDIPVSRDIPAIRTSSDLFRTDFGSEGGVTTAPWESEFSDLIRELGYVPDGELLMKFTPLCVPAGKSNRLIRFSEARKLAFGPTAEVLTPTGYPQFRSVSEIQAILPGAPVTAILPEIRTSRPTFSFQSNLADRSQFTYPVGQKRFEVKLWKVQPGEDPREAISRRPLHSLETDEINITFPASWTPLEPEAVYAWRVDARLIGPVTEALSSELYGFRLAAATLAASELTPDQRRLLELLRIVLGPRYDDMVRSLGGKVPDMTSVRIDGRLVTIEELERLAADYEAQRIHVVGMRLP